MIFAREGGRRVLYNVAERRHSLGYGGRVFMAQLHNIFYLKIVSALERCPFKEDVIFRKVSLYQSYPIFNLPNKIYTDEN